MYSVFYHHIKVFLHTSTRCWDVRHLPGFMTVYEPANHPISYQQVPSDVTKRGDKVNPTLLIFDMSKIMPAPFYIRRSFRW